MASKSLPKSLIAHPLTAQEAKRYLRVGMTIAWKPNTPDTYKETKNGWFVEIVESKKELKLFIKYLKNDGDLIVILSP